MGRLTGGRRDDARQAGIDAGNDAVGKIDAGDEVVDEVMPPSSFTRRNACASTRNPRQARWPVLVPAAGNVAASMARRCPDQLKSWRKYIVPTAWVNQRCGGRVLGETQHRDVEGIAGTHTKPPSAARQRRADEP